MISAGPRPEDPSIWEMPGTNINLRFSDYGQQLPPAQVLAVLIQVLLTTIDKLIDNRGNTAFKEDMDFQYRHAGFIAYAGQWGMNYRYDQLATAIKGIVGFMIQYNAFAFNVDILDSGGNKISNCYLFYVD